MESTLEINSVPPQRSSALPKIAILIYWASVLQYFYIGFFQRSITKTPVSTHTMPASLLLGLLVFFLAFGVFKLLLAFKLSKRKNWARIVVVIIAAAQAVLLIQGTIAMAHVSQQAVLTLVTHAWGLYGEILVAVLLLLSQSRSWFAPTRASNPRF